MSRNKLENDIEMMEALLAGETLQYMNGKDVFTYALVGDKLESRCNGEPCYRGFLDVEASRWERIVPLGAYEKCKILRHAIMTHSAEIMAYSSGEGTTSTLQIQEIYAKQLENLGKIDIKELTVEQMEDLGFSKCSEANPMGRIPLWLYRFLPEDLEVEVVLAR